MARALFFGRLRDHAGAESRDVALDAPVDIAEFRRRLTAGDVGLEAALAARTVRIAINAVLLPASAPCTIAPGDEVAFMPLFSGG